jgi:hypothetical protein
MRCLASFLMDYLLFERDQNTSSTSSTSLTQSLSNEFSGTLLIKVQLTFLTYKVCTECKFKYIIQQIKNKHLNQFETHLSSGGEIYTSPMIPWACCGHRIRWQPSQRSWEPEGLPKSVMKVGAAVLWAVTLCIFFGPVVDNFGGR